MTYLMMRICDIMVIVPRFQRETKKEYATCIWNEEKEGLRAVLNVVKREQILEFLAKISFT